MRPEQDEYQVVCHDDRFYLRLRGERPAGPGMTVAYGDEDYCRRIMLDMKTKKLGCRLKSVFDRRTRKAKTQ